MTDVIDREYYEGRIKELGDALTECLDVLQGKEMMGVWGFLYAHGFKWTGPVLPVEDMRRLVGGPSNG